jgi:hypothetical protein
LIGGVIPVVSCRSVVAFFAKKATTAALTGIYDNKIGGAIIFTPLTTPVFNRGSGGKNKYGPLS